MGQSIEEREASACDENGQGEGGEKVSRQRIEQARHPERHLARQAVAVAVSGGYLVRPEVCSRCGSPEKIEGHHNSYALEDWLTVEWLCSRCHHERHRKGEPLNRIVNIRFTPSEYDALKAAVGERNVAPAIRAIVAHAVKQGIEVSK